MVRRFFWALLVCSFLVLVVHRFEPVVTEPGALLALKNEGLSLEARLAMSRFLPGKDEIVPLRVLLDARDPARSVVQRPSLNLAFVVDRSGSMEDDGRMEQVKRTLVSLAERLSSADRVALISYATGVKVHFSGPFDRSVLLAAIAELRPVGGTNLADGLAAGCEELEKGMGAGINRLLLFSDGIANIGTREPREILAELKGCLGRGISLTSIGVGADYNEDLLAELAERGRGNYYFIESPSSIAAALDRELNELSTVVAREGSLRLELPEGVELEKVYGYEHRQEGRFVVIPMKDLVAGERRKVLVDLRIHGGAGGSQAVVRPSLVYREGKLESDKSMVLQAARSEAEAAASVDEEVASEVLYTRNAEALQAASRLVEQGQAGEAQSQINAAMDRSKSRTVRSSKLKKQALELEESLQWVQSSGKSEQAQKLAVKRMKNQARVYTKE